MMSEFAFPWLAEVTEALAIYKCIVGDGRRKRARISVPSVLKVRGPNGPRGTGMIFNFLISLFKKP